MLEEVSAQDILNKKMLPARKRDPEDAASEKSIDKPLDDPIAETISQIIRFVPAKETESLNKLPYELLVEIAKRKKLEDFTCFRCVSRSLHLSVEEGDFEGLRLRKKLPYLMLPPDGSSGDGNDDTRRQFYSLVEGESIIGSLEIPMFNASTKMCFESLGWLLTLEFDGSTSLLDPLSNTEIPLPHVHTFPLLERLINPDKRNLITKMVLSSRPNETSDFIMMVIIGDCKHLAYWRLGDKAWNKIGDDQRGFRDIVYVGGGQFYAIRAMGHQHRCLQCGVSYHHREYPRSTHS